MVIESAEKFGLSQLHQLRGRVGRGKEQSYCILLSSVKAGREAKERLKIMCNTNDGFLIAEKDLELRGPGDIDGTRQSGEEGVVSETAISNYSITVCQFKVQSTALSGPINISRASQFQILFGN